MDYRKIDAGLATIFKNDKRDLDKRDLTVFIQTEHLLSTTEVITLEKFGIKNPGDRKIITATLSLGEVDKLSDQPWIKYIKLSRELRPL